MPIEHNRPDRWLAPLGRYGEGYDLLVREGGLKAKYKILCLLYSPILELSNKLVSVVFNAVDGSEF